MTPQEIGDGDDAPGQVLFRLVRHWSRRAITANPTDSERGRDVWVTEAVHSLLDDGRAEASVNAVAIELGVDQSGASRMLTHGIDARYLGATPSATDGRRRSVVITPAGRDLLAGAHAWQEQVFAQLTQDWTQQERVEFHRGMQRLTAATIHGTVS